MRVLVTGASGFAGGYVARALAEAGLEVTAVTRGRGVLPPPSAQGSARFRVVRADLASGIELTGGHDAVVHAAATSAWCGVPVDTIVRDNVLATRSLIGHALAARTGKLVFFSSVSAFGRINAPVVDESTPVTDPDPYGTAKLLCEHMLRGAAEDLPSIALRLPAIVGPGARRNFLAETARKLSAGEPVSCFNPTGQFNNAVHVADLAIFIHRLLTGSAWGGFDMLVLAAAGEITVRDAVARLIERIAPGADIGVRISESPSFVLDTTKARTRYGFAPMAIGATIDRFAAESAAEFAG